MASSLSHYYASAKGGLAHIDPKEMADLTEDFMITALTGAGLGLASASLGGLDKKIAGFPVPLDGLASIALGFASLSTRSPGLKIASIAAGGSAATRTFEAIFKKGIGVHGEFEDLGGGYGGMGFGGGSHDRLVEAAKYL